MSVKRIVQIHVFDGDVYLAVNGSQMERVSAQEARKYLKQKGREARSKHESRATDKNARKKAAHSI